MKGVLAALLLQAAPQAAPPEVIRTRDWVLRPSSADFARVYPEGAQRRELQGRATLKCQVTEAGSMTACVVFAEDPPGAEFGAAALKLAPVFSMRPLSQDGKPVAGGTVIIPLRFRLPGGGLDRIDMIAGCYGEVGATVERSPSDPEAMRAYGFYASQFAQIASGQKMRPSTFEGALTRERENALKPGGGGPPDYQTCLRHFRRYDPSATQ